jgi:hypothetical protein
MLNSLLSLPAVVGEVFRSLDATPLAISDPIYHFEEEACIAQRRAANGYTVAFGSATVTGDDFIEGPSEIRA